MPASCCTHRLPHAPHAAHDGVPTCTGAIRHVDRLVKGISAVPPIGRGLYDVQRYVARSGLTGQEALENTSFANLDTLVQHSVVQEDKLTYKVQASTAQQRTDAKRNTELNHMHPHSPPQPNVPGMLTSRRCHMR